MPTTTADGNGNVTYLIGPTGQVLAHSLYDPFGNALAVVGPVATACSLSEAALVHHRHPQGGVGQVQRVIHLPAQPDDGGQNDWIGCRED